MLIADAKDVALFWGGAHELDELTDLNGCFANKLKRSQKRNGEGTKRGYLHTLAMFCLQNHQPEALRFEFAKVTNGSQDAK